MVAEALFSSARTGEKDQDEWQTPRWLFDRCERELDISFDLDAAASDDNFLCPNYFTEQRSALVLPWIGTHVWCNPPYSMLREFTEAALRSLDAGHYKSATFLIPARTDTVAFHALAERASVICFMKGRVKFVGAEHGAPFPSALVRISKTNWRGTHFVDWRDPTPKKTKVAKT